MKIEIYKEGEQKEEVLRLSLRQVGSQVLLRAVSANGAPILSGNLIKINSEGVFTACKRVDRTLGLDLDREGKVNVK